MSKFKIGDRVKIIASTYFPGGYTQEMIGDVLEITDIDTLDDTYEIHTADKSTGSWFNEPDLELFAEKDYSLPNAAVHTTTQAEYDEVMQKYEEIGWDICDWWDNYKQETCVEINPNYEYCGKAWYVLHGRPILTMQQWREHFGVEPKGEVIYETDPVDPPSTPWTRLMCDCEWCLPPTEPTIKSTKEKSIMRTLRTLSKRMAIAFNANDKALYQAGYIDDQLNPTPKARDQLLEILFDEHKDALAALAEAEIKEIKAEAKRSK